MLNENQDLTRIANSALAAIGSPPIDDLSDDNSAVAKTVRLLLDQTIREVQGYHLVCWDELLNTEALTLCQERENAGDGLVYGCNIPVDNLAIENVFDEKMRFARPWKTESGVLWTDVSKGFVTYVRYSENPAKWSYELKNAVIGLLTARLASAITKKFAAGEQLRSQFWNVDFPQLVGNKKRKANRDRRGNDEQFTQYYPNGFEGRY